MHVVKSAPAWLLVFALSGALSGVGVALAGVEEDGYAALAAKNYDQAARLLGQARVEHPDDPRLADALGTALYRAGRFREAEQIFTALAESSTDAGDAARARYNAGNAAYAGGRLDQALSAYQQSMSKDALFKEAQQNAAAVQKEIQARRTPPPPEQQDQQQQDQQQQDQDKQAGKEGEDSQAGDPKDGQSAESQQADKGDGSRPEDAKPGEQGVDPGDPADGSASNGEAQQAAAEGQPGEGAPGEGEAQSDRVEGDPGGEGQPGDAVATGEPGEGSGMTKAQAAQLVDSVQDGKPSVVVGTPSGGKDW